MKELDKIKTKGNEKEVVKAGESLSFMALKTCETWRHKFTLAFEFSPDLSETISFWDKTSCSMNKE